MLDENHLIDLNKKLSCIHNKNLEKTIEEKKKIKFLNFFLIVLMFSSAVYQIYPLIEFNGKTNLIQGFDNFQLIAIQHFLVFLLTPFFFLAMMIMEDLEELKKEIVFLKRKKFSNMKTTSSILSVFFEGFFLFFIVGVFLNGFYLQVSPKNDFFQLSDVVQVLQLVFSLTSFLFVFIFSRNNKNKTTYLNQNPVIEKDIQSYLMKNITNLDNYYLFKAYAEKNSLIQLIEYYDDKIKENISKKNGFETFKDFEISELMKKNRNILTINNN